MLGVAGNSPLKDAPNLIVTPHAAFYSEANKTSGITWSEKHMYEYLLNPKRYVVGTRMQFPGIRSATERARSASMQRFIVQFDRMRGRSTSVKNDRGTDGKAPTTWPWTPSLQCVKTRLGAPPKRIFPPAARALH